MIGVAEGTRGGKGSPVVVSSGEEGTDTGRTRGDSSNLRGKGVGGGKGGERRCRSWVRKRGIRTVEEAMGKGADATKGIDSKGKKEDLAVEQFVRDRGSIGDLRARGASLSKKLGVFGIAQHGSSGIRGGKSAAHN